MVRVQAAPLIFMETLILVDEKDKQIGTASREECHRFPGKLHRAILVVVKNKKGEILLAKRDKRKLFGGLWDGTIATHVLVGETPEQAARRALEKELGVSNLSLNNLGNFIYKAKWGKNGVEDEFCHLFSAEAEEVIPNLKEISETTWVTKDELTNYSLTPWFLEALKFL